MSSFRHYVTDLWRGALQRRSQRDRSPWQRMAQLAAEFSPLPHILHPWPSERLPSNTKDGSFVIEGAPCCRRHWARSSFRHEIVRNRDATIDERWRSSYERSLSPLCAHGNARFRLATPGQRLGRPKAISYQSQRTLSTESRAGKPTIAQ
jgi:hypothetical protein